MEHDSAAITAELLTLRKEVGPRDVRYFNADGNLHRVHGPAIIWHYGTRIWYQNGYIHRIDGPAAEYYDGYKEWYEYGEFIRGEPSGTTDSSESSRQ